MSGSRTAVKPGTYVIFNAEYGTALSLSPTSPPTLNCRPFDAAGSAYQQWKFVPTDESDHFLIQPMAKSNLSSPRYLTIGGLLREGAKGSVTVGSFPMAWKVTRGEFGLRISFPTSDLHLAMTKVTDESVQPEIALEAPKLLSLDDWDLRYDPDVGKEIWARISWVSNRCVEREGDRSHSAVRVHWNECLDTEESHLNLG